MHVGTNVCWGGGRERGSKKKKNLCHSFSTACSSQVYACVRCSFSTPAAARFQTTDARVHLISCARILVVVTGVVVVVQVAVCNLASINLAALVIPPPAEEGEGARATYDFAKLQHIAEVVTRNLNRVIEVNYYPIPEARNSNMRHRPIGIGVQVRGERTDGRVGGRQGREEREGRAGRPPKRACLSA